MHKRKIYEVYPSGYNPDKDVCSVRSSKRQAKKLATKFGGAYVNETVHTHPDRFQGWVSSRIEKTWRVGV